jgi:hypothetical protein
MIEPLTGNVVMSEVDARMCHTKQGRKTRVLWGFSYYHKMYNATAEMSNKPRSLYPSSTLFCFKNILTHIL